MNPIRAGNKKFHLHSPAPALVEFAIIVPILLLVLTAIIEFGYAFYTWAAIGEVRRIGTRSPSPANTILNTVMTRPPHWVW